MVKHIRIFNNDEDFLAAQRLLDDNDIEYSVVTKPAKLQGKGNCDKGIVYGISDGMKISSILSSKGIDTKCFSMAIES